MTGARQKALFSAAGALLVAGCLVLLNLLAARLYVRLDLSEGRVYSLSPGSRRLLAKLPGPVELRVYFSKELPPEYAASRRYLRDLLKEYHSASGGKVRHRFIDVDKDEASRSEALKQGVAPVQFNVISSEKYEIRDGFMGLVLQHEDRKEVLPVITKTEGLEYDLTTRILTLTRREKAAVGLVSSHGAVGPGALAPAVREYLERSYELRDVDLAALKPGATVPGDLAGLMLLGPTERLKEPQLYALDQFLLSGRPLVLGVDTRRADLQSMMVSGLDTGLPDWLAGHGVRLVQNFVLDEQCQQVAVSQQRGIFMVRNVIPFRPFVVATDLSKDHPVTRHLQSLTLPLVSPVDVSSVTARAMILARSSRYSWLRAAWGRGMVHSINPLQAIAPEQEDPRGPFALAAALEGAFRSGFAPGALPKGADSKAFRERTEAGRLVVIGTSRFAHADMPTGESGAVFLLNLADWIGLDPDLIAIRSKGAVFRPLEEIPPPFKTALRWTNILGPAFMVAAFGALRARRRRLLSARRAAEFSPGKKHEPAVA